MIDAKGLSDEPSGEVCIASDMITKEGWKVGYMFRDEHLKNQPDSGWHFLKGDENDEYPNNSQNHHVAALNIICNYGHDIIQSLKSLIETKLIRTRMESLL